MRNRLDTGYWAYYTDGDGLCCFDARDEAVAAATKAAKREQEQVDVYKPDGGFAETVGRNLPTHEQRCMHPEIYGYEDEYETSGAEMYGYEDGYEVSEATEFAFAEHGG